MRTRNDLLKQKIRKELVERIENSTRRVELLDEIRLRDNKLATMNEDSILKYHQGDLATNEILALMLEAKARKREQKGLAYQPFLLLGDDYLNQWTLNQLIQDLTQKKQPFHYDFIMKTADHCSPFQLDFDGEHLRVFFIDAAGDPRNMNHLFDLLRNQPQPTEKYVYHQGGIQTDFSSCAIFSIQHLNNLSTLPLETRQQLNHDTIDHLPPIFLKNIQTSRDLDRYYAQNPNQTMGKQQQTTLKQHIDDFSINVDVSAAGDGSQTRPKNYAIAYKNHKYLKAALATLDAANADELEQLLQSRCDLLGKNTLANQHDDDTALLQTQMVQQHLLAPRNIANDDDLVLIAMQKNKPELMFELIKQDVDFNHTLRLNGAKITPLSWAISQGNLALVEALIERYPDAIHDEKHQPMPYLHQIISNPCPNPVDMLQLFQSKNININMKDDKGETIVHACVGSSDIPLDERDVILHELIHLRADVNAPDDDGNTPLHRVSDARFVPTLVAAGAKVNAKNTSGETPLYTKQLHVLNALIQCGANVNQQNNNHETHLDKLFKQTSRKNYPEHLAIINRELMNALERAGALRSHSNAYKERYQQNLAPTNEQTDIANTKNPYTP